jgi:oxalate decarboxylase/phosphoglucose isomerase-like protein (cupin superfamily)
MKERTMAARVLKTEEFNALDYAHELDVVAANFDVGTKMLFANDKIRVWEVRLQPGERGAFHTHATRYFWTVIHGGIGRQRSQDGSMITREYSAGDTSYLEHSPEDTWFHDFENFGTTDMLFLTVELLD